MRNHIKTLTLGALIACVGCSQDSKIPKESTITNQQQTQEYTFQGPTIQKIFQTYTIPEKDKEDIEKLHTLYQNGQISQATFNTILNQDYQRQ